MTTKKPVSRAKAATSPAAKQPAKAAKTQQKKSPQTTAQSTGASRAIPEPQPSPADSADQVDAQLARYRSMRHFDVTAEPAGAASDGTASTLPFCIQKHAASHLHYDFRLGWNGVLKSWACAKGPKLLPSVIKPTRRTGRRPPHGIRRLRRHHPSSRPVRRRHRHALGPRHLGATGRTRPTWTLACAKAQLKFTLHVRRPS